MKESTMLKKWVKEQLEEAAKHRNEESKILGKVYEKCKEGKKDETKKS